LNLNTHFLFAAAAAAFLVGKPEAILMAGIGSIIPDLDRPYWFIPKMRVDEEEYHRSFLHNIVVLALAYLFNPYFGLGLFSHLLLDSMTTVKDRGVEWLFPFTRMISKDYWSQAEVQQEPLVWMPWRRTYGPALNGHMLDTYVSLCSVGALVSWSALQSLHFFLDGGYWFTSGFVILAGVAFSLFVSGEYVKDWSGWSKQKKLRARALLVLILLVIAVSVVLFGHGDLFAWKDTPKDLLLSSNNFLNKLFLMTITAYSFTVLRYIRPISIALANVIPALCTKMSSRDFFIDKKENEPDVFV
jgi:hypothetical protein